MRGMAQAQGVMLRLIIHIIVPAQLRARQKCRAGIAPTSSKTSLTVCKALQEEGRVACVAGLAPKKLSRQKKQRANFPTQNRVVLGALAETPLIRNPSERKEGYFRALLRAASEGVTMREGRARARSSTQSVPVFLKARTCPTGTHEDAATHTHTRKASIHTGTPTGHTHTYASFAVRSSHQSIIPLLFPASTAQLHMRICGERSRRME